jgi:predicted phage terminase large subunit-like protein
MITMPPRHGKSQFLSEYFPAWFVGNFPDKRVILTSYEADFAAQWGRKARFLLETYGHTFPSPIRLSPCSAAASRWDIAGHTGGMQTSGAGGAITGKGGHLIIIDDPIKNSDDAMSDRSREKLMEWYASTLYTRREPGAIVILIQTRWHMDDLAGKLIKQMEAGGDTWTVVDFPAIAETDDVIGRKPGEPLWEDRFPLTELTKIKMTQGSYWWNALYQQHPIPPGGQIFRTEWFKVVEDFPHDCKKCRFWDMAATKDGGDYTVGGLVGLSKEGQIFILDVQRGQLSPYETESMIGNTAGVDGRDVKIRIEKEGGSAGKTLMDQYARKLLLGYDFKGEVPSGSKESRANPLAAAAEAGNVYLVRAPWNRAMLDEFTNFPHGSNDDQVDAISGAFNVLVTTRARPKFRAVSS